MSQIPSKELEEKHKSGFAAILDAILKCKHYDPDLEGVFDDIYKKIEKMSKEVEETDVENTVIKVQLSEKDESIKCFEQELVEKDFEIKWNRRAMETYYRLLRIYGQNAQDFSEENDELKAKLREKDLVSSSDERT